MSAMESDTENDIAEAWGQKYEEYMDYGAKQNATFSLHLDMMRHCDDIIAILFVCLFGS